jgi:DNA-binding response OmpR family regulator
MPSGIFQFADFELDRNVYELRHNGHPLKLERIPLDLLFLLTDRRDQLVTREESSSASGAKGSSSMRTTRSTRRCGRFAVRWATTPMRPGSSPRFQRKVIGS